MREFINDLNELLWGAPAVAVFLFTGIFFSIKLGFFQVRRPLLIFRKTLLSRSANNKNGVSPYKAACTALSACIGTGNIVGAAAGVAAGGAGALFWMWTASFFGMATAYAENSLSISCRRKCANGFVGGAMYTIRDGLSILHGGSPNGFSKYSSIIYAIFTVLASLGMGAAAQVNTAANALSDSFGIYPIAVGAAFVLLYIIICRGGMRRTAGVAAIVVPVMSVIYCGAASAVLFINRDRLSAVLAQVFRGAFGFEAVTGGFSGSVLARAVSQGIRRGVFSNEAGLGSAAAAHASSSLECASHAGLWGAFEVFFDTIFMCTLTALTVLCVPEAQGVGGAFAAVFGSAAEKIVGVCLSLFAFSTVIGWGAYGENAAVFALGAKSTTFFRCIFAFSLISGAIGSFDAVWGISDLFNLLLAVPNIIFLYLLSPMLEPAFCGRLKKPAVLLSKRQGKRQP